jgi:uncharacterized protein YndB with AHSA1/START domain
MDHYRRHLLLAASPRAVYAALTTQDGLRQWWTHTCDVGTEVGSRSTFRFGPHHKVMEIERLVPEREVVWRCVVAHIAVASFQRKDEWVGTRIVFRLSPARDGKTVLDFEHIGLTPEFECHEACVEGWDQYLGSLKALVESGQGAPFVPGNSCSVEAREMEVAQ